MKTTTSFRSRLLALCFGAGSLIAATSALSAGAVPGSAEAAKPAPEPDRQSIRYVDRPDGRAELQTAVITMRHPSGQQVDLVSAVHIGDETYFEALNQLLAGYDVVLYELVGGPMETRDEKAGTAELGAARLVQRLAQSMLGLSYQLDGIDYKRPNFVHADATWDDWERLTKERNQTMATLFQRAMEMQNDPKMKEEIEKMGSETMFPDLLAAVREFDPAKFKRTLAPMLSEAEGFVTKLEGEDGTVVITERNKIVMQSIEEQLAKGHRKIAVFYGAGHMPDFETRLEALGFREDGREWLAAWNIGGETATVSGLDLLETMLKDDQVVDSVITFFRTFIGEPPVKPEP